MTEPATVLVTGAGGFVGGHVIAALRAGLPTARIVVEPVDLRDRDAIERQVRDVRPDGCLHLAAIAAPREAAADPDEAWAVNLGGTLALAHALLRQAPGCRLVFAGSADSYGASFRDGHAVDEDRPLAPQTVYAATKAAADLALGALAASEGLRAVRLRPTNHTGPGQREAFVVAAFARQIALIEAGLQAPVLRVGALEPERDFLDVRDVARAYVLALSAAVAPGTTLNIAAGTPRAVGAVLDELLALGTVRPAIERDPTRVRKVDLPRAACDPGRAERLLGWRPLLPWSRTLADVLDDWRGRIRTDTGAFDRSEARRGGERPP